MSTTSTHRMRLLIMAGLLLVVSVGCQGTFPADAQGTLERARGGELRVGISENPPWAEVAADGTVGGSEVEMLTDYAATIDAEILWVPGGEDVLAAGMKEGELDLVIGGLASDAPWTPEMALTRPYATTQGPGESTVKIVVGVRPGRTPC